MLESCCTVGEMYGHWYAGERCVSTAPRSLRVVGRVSCGTFHVLIETFCCMMATSVITRARMKLISRQTRKVGIGQGTSLAFHQSRLGQWVFVLPYLVVLRVARDLAAGADDPCSPYLPPFPHSSVSGPVWLRQKTTRYGEYSPGIVRGVAFNAPFEMNRYGG